MSQDANQSKSNQWYEAASVRLPGGQSIACRWRVLSRGIFDEDEIQLVWEKSNGEVLKFLISDSHAGYPELNICARPDMNGVWIVAKMNDQTESVIASLDLQTLEFHNEADFIARENENAWAMVIREEDVLKETQLIWTRSSINEMQQLFHGSRVWESFDGINWDLVSGKPALPYEPRALTMPFKMQPPDWIL